MEFSPEDVDITSLPSVLLAHRLSLPPCSAVYFVISPLGEVLYIGKSENLKRRWGNHHILRKIGVTDDAQIAWWESSRKTPEIPLELIEQHFIRHFQPPLNLITWKEWGDDVLTPVNLRWHESTLKRLQVFALRAKHAGVKPDTQQEISEVAVLEYMVNRGIEEV